MRLAHCLSWGLPLLTAAVYAGLLWRGAALGEMAGGLTPFDLRPSGYSLAEARGFLRALTPDGFALYAHIARRWDAVFPALMGLTFLWWMRPFSGVFGMVCVLVAMSYVALDWGENAAVLAMLDAGPDWVSLAEVQRASIFTQCKFLAFALALVLALRQSWRRVKA